MRITSFRDFIAGQQPVVEKREQLAHIRQLLE
jgi:hypothetical protein